MWQKLLLIAVMGSVGTLARYGLQGWVQRLSGGAFPWGTLAVNVLGCFLFGVVSMLAEERGLIRTDTRIIALVGFMGAFTTFSTFAFETATLLEDRQWMFAIGNVVLQNVLGVVAIFAGFFVGRAI